MFPFKFSSVKNAYNTMHAVYVGILVALPVMYFGIEDIPKDFLVVLGILLLAMLSWISGGILMEYIKIAHDDTENDVAKLHSDLRRVVKALNVELPVSRGAPDMVRSIEINDISELNDALEKLKTDIKAQMKTSKGGDDE